MKDLCSICGAKEVPTWDDLIFWGGKNREHNRAKINLKSQLDSISLHCVRYDYGFQNSEIYLARLHDCHDFHSANYLLRMLCFCKIS